METNLSQLKMLAPNLGPWKTHDWIGRRIKPVDGDSLILQVCSECYRGFVEERSTGQHYGVHVSIFKLHRLSDEVTTRWLSENCPATLLKADDADRRTRYGEGSYGSAPAEIANEHRFRSVPKSMSQQAAAYSNGSITKSSRRNARQRSGAVSSKSIIFGSALPEARPPPEDRRQSPQAITASLNPSSSDGEPGGGSRN
jgi:hypothetical protein